MKGKTILLVLLRFVGLLAIAQFIASLLMETGLPQWAVLFILFVSTKLFFDILVYIFSGQKKFLYLEDYLREMSIYLIVAAISVAGVTAVEFYFHGQIWQPLLAAGLVYVWRK